MRFVLHRPPRGILRWRTTPQTRHWFTPVDPTVPLVMVNQYIDGKPVLCREHDIELADTLDLHIIAADARVSTDRTWDGRRQFGLEQLLTAVIVLPRIE